MKHLGIVACSAEGAALCYRTICLEALNVVGEHNHPEITMNSIPMARHMEYIYKNDWKGVGDLMFESAEKVARAGAAFAICPDNTVHQAFPYFVSRSPIPWLHIAEVVAEEATRKGFRKLALLGTRYLMEGPVYTEALKKFGVERDIPAPEAREHINTIIFKELVNAIFTDNSRNYFYDQMSLMKREYGCDAAVLGCTEIPLIVRPEEAPLPTLDSTRLLAKAALAYSLKDE